MGEVRTDRWGAALKRGNEHGVPLFNAAVEALVSLNGDPLSAANTAVAADDDLVLGHILRAYLCLYTTSTDGLSNARKVLEDMDGIVDLGEREVLHLRAHALLGLRPVGRCHALPRASPSSRLTDLLALKVAQDLYFFLGQSKDILGVVVGVLGAWPPERLGWGYLQGMYAFGLEETGDYQQAEVRARAALQKEARDTWASHALAHVFEMQGRQPEGIAFLDAFIAALVVQLLRGPQLVALRVVHHLELGKIRMKHSRSTTGRFEAPAQPNGSTWLTPPPCCGGSRSSHMTWRIAFSHWPPTSSQYSMTPSISSMIGTPSWSSAWPSHDLNERVLTSNRRAALRVPTDWLPSRWVSHCSKDSVRSRHIATSARSIS